MPGGVLDILSPPHLSHHATDLGLRAPSTLSEETGWSVRERGDREATLSMPKKPDRVACTSHPPGRITIRLKDLERLKFGKESACG